MIRNGNLEILGKLINPKINSLDAGDIPAFVEEDKGLIVFNNDLKTLTLNTGEGFVSLLTDEASNETFITSLGTNWFNSNLSFNPTPFNALDNISGLNADSSLFDVIVQLDTAINSMNIDDINSIGNVNTEAKEDKFILYFDDNNLIAGSISDLAEELSISFDDLSNTTLTDLTDNDYIVYDSSSEKLVNKKKSFVYENLLSVPVHDVQHNLGERYCFVTVVDRDTNLALSTSQYSLNYVSANNLTVSTKQLYPLTVLVQTI